MNINRRRVLVTLPAFAVCKPLLGAWAHSRTPQRVLLGTGGESKGIYTASWNAVTGELGAITLAAAVESPSFLAVHPRHHDWSVYAVSEANGGAARLSAYSLDPAKDMLHKVNDMPSGGDGPAHVAISGDGRAVFCANYGGGSISSFRVEKDGSLSEAVSHYQFEGSGPYGGRQDKPHTHSVNPSPDGKWLLVCDLGLDKVFVFHMNTRTAKLTAEEPAFWAAKPGSGPRHLAFHPNGRWLYVVNELTSTVDTLDWDSHQGRLTHKGSVSTLKEGFPPNTAFAGEILCSHDGAQVYVGNRVADNSIAVFDVHPQTGLLTLMQLAQNPGVNPRHLALDPTGRWLVISDVGSSAVFVLLRDVATGRLSDTGHQYALSSVEFVAFV